MYLDQTAAPTCWGVRVPPIAQKSVVAAPAKKHNSSPWLLTLGQPVTLDVYWAATRPQVSRHIHRLGSCHDCRESCVPPAPGVCKARPGSCRCSGAAAAAAGAGQWQSALWKAQSQAEITDPQRQRNQRQRYLNLCLSSAHRS